MKNEMAVERRRVLRRYSAQDRVRLMGEQARSGLSIKAFCEREGIPAWRFYGWTSKAGKATSGIRFAEVSVGPSPATAVEVLLPNGVRVGIRHQGGQDELAVLVRGVAGYGARRVCRC